MEYSVTDLLARDAEMRRTKIAKAQELDARLIVLEQYDMAREPLGHDYGNGQRHSELIRVRREREAAMRDCSIFGYGQGIGDLLARPEQLREALREISGKRLRRYHTDAHLSATRQRAFDAWREASDQVHRIGYERKLMGL